MALGLLFCLVLPVGFAWRLGLALAAGLALPFILQDPGYVARQYPRWLDNLANDDRSDWDVVGGYRDGWLLVRRSGLPLDRTGYVAVQLAAAAFAASLCLAMRWRRVRGRTRSVSPWLSGAAG